jgi:multidrug resistance efflux pump
MNWDKFIGPATLIYLVSATVAGIWWASDLTARVSTAEAQVRIAATASERITRVEVLLVGMDKQLDKIDARLDRRP